jgi:hypothetical protein
LEWGRESGVAGSWAGLEVRNEGNAGEPARFTGAGLKYDCRRGSTRRALNRLVRVVGRERKTFAVEVREVLLVGGVFR